jgi:hypothetical protein
MLKKAIATGAVPSRLRPRPIAEIRARNYRDLELGVRDFVRQLDEAGYVPVWSCQGHRQYDLPPTWCDSPVLRRLKRAGIAWWRMPRVVCAGPWAVDHRRLGVRGFDFLALSISIRPIAHGLMRALPGETWKVESRAWTLFVQTIPRQTEKVSRALNCLSDEGDGTFPYIRIA